MRHDLSEMKIGLNIVSRDEHVPEVSTADYYQEFVMLLKMQVIRMTTTTTKFPTPVGMIVMIMMMTITTSPPYE